MKLSYRACAIALCLSLTLSACSSKKSSSRGSGSTAVAGPSLPATFSLLTPTSGATGIGLTPTLSWQTSAGATSYSYQLDDSASFSAPLLEDLTLPSGTTSHAVPSGLLAAGQTYYWRVTATNSAGSIPASNAPSSFTTLANPPPSSFALLTPSNGASSVALAPALTWQDSDETAFTIQIDDSSSFTAPLLYDNPNLAANTTSFNVPSGLLQAGLTYYWKVIARNANGSTPCNTPFSFTTNSTSNQAPGFARTYGGTASDIAKAVTPCPDGGIAVAGLTNSFGATGRDVWVFKLNSDASLSWQFRYGTTANEEAYAIEPTSDGGFMVGGVCNASGSDDALLMKLRADGSLEWHKTLGLTREESVRSILPIAGGTGGYIFTGIINEGVNMVDVLVAKVAADGTLTWAKRYGGTDWDEGRSLSAVPGGSGYFVCGSIYSLAAGVPEYWVLKLATDGTVVWQKAYGGSGNEEARAVVAMSDGGCVVAGVTDTFGTGDFDNWLLRLNSDGSIAWQKTFGGIIAEDPEHMSLASDGSLLVAGLTANSFGPGPDFWLLKVTPAGAMTWARRYGAGGTEYGQGVRAAADGRLLFVGQTTVGAGITDAWVLRTASDGVLTPVYGDTPATELTTNVTPQTTSASFGDIGLSSATAPFTVTATSATIGQQAP